VFLDTNTIWFSNKTDFNKIQSSFKFKLENTKEHTQRDSISYAYN